MTEALTETAPRMDRALLAKLTGGLGDSKTLQRLCADFGQLYVEFLPDVFHSETGLTMQVHYNGHESGLMTSLDLVELNPFLDDRGRTAKLMVDLVGSLMGKKVFDRPTRSF